MTTIAPETTPTAAPSTSAALAPTTAWERFAWLLVQPPWALHESPDALAAHQRAAGEQVRAWAISAGIVVGPMFVLLVLTARH